MSSGISSRPLALRHSAIAETSLCTKSSAAWSRLSELASLGAATSALGDSDDFELGRDGNLLIGARPLPNRACRLTHGSGAAPVAVEPDKTVETGQTGNLKPGTSRTFSLRLPAGSYCLVCEGANNETGPLTVTGSAATPTVRRRVSRSVGRRVHGQRSLRRCCPRAL